MAMASVSLKICDVFADGTSALVTRGSLALGPLEPGRVHDVVMELDACAYGFDPGHRMRLSFAGTDWPNTVAPPVPATLTVHGGELAVPVWSGPSPHAAPHFRAGAPTSNESADGVVWRVGRDVLSRETACEIEHGSTYDLPYDGSATEHYRGRVSVDTHTFVQRAVGDVDITVRWPDVIAVASSHLDVRIAAEAYEVDLHLEVREGRPGEDGPGELVGERSWERRLPR